MAVETTAHLTHNFPLNGYRSSSENMYAKEFQPPEWWYTRPLESSLRKLSMDTAQYTADLTATAASVSAHYSRNRDYYGHIRFGPLCEFKLNSQGVSLLAQSFDTPPLNTEPDLPFITHELHLQNERAAHGQKYGLKIIGTNDDHTMMIHDWNGQEMRVFDTRGFEGTYDMYSALQQQCEAGMLGRLFDLYGLRFPFQLE